MDTDPFNFSHMDMQGDFIPDNIPVTHFDSLDDMPQSPVVDEPHVEPYVGMVFNSLEEVVGFYNSFAKAKGLGFVLAPVKRIIAFCTTLQDFVVKYEKAINNRYEDEKREDFESRHKLRILSIGSKIEEHAASVYTRNVFGKFHNELASVSQFTKEKIEKNSSQCKYRVSNCFNARDTFIVDINLESKNARCGCQLFEFMGILCRHIMVIFQAKNIIQIPSEYILERWTKEANRYIEVGALDIQNRESDVLRSMHVQRQFEKFATLAKRSEDAYKFIVGELDRVYEIASTIRTEMSNLNEAPLEPNNQNFMFDTNYDDSSFNIKNPHISQTKGRKRNDSDKLPLAGRYKSGLELSMNKSLVKRRACKSCGEYGHYQSTCKQKRM
ncbi:Zinc finger, CCHC-type [Sesbania bispinosa]|nr:Zinc finger, CCHC-type [Sesbania bispinosa]